MVVIGNTNHLPFCDTFVGVSDGFSYNQCVLFPFKLSTCTVCKSAV